jgi:hypothetical protein
MLKIILREMWVRKPGPYNAESEGGNLVSSKLLLKQASKSRNDVTFLVHSHPIFII